MLRRIRAHPRAAAAGVLCAGALLAFVIAAARSQGGGGCDAPPPVTNLPQALRGLGDFDQPYDAGDVAAILDAASRAAGAVHPDLAGQTVAPPGDPVRIRAMLPGRHDALVVPLLGGSSATGGTHVWGLVDFLYDCSGRLHLDQIVDLFRGGGPPASFPDVDRAEAARELGVTDPELVHTGDPLAPLWRAPASGRTVTATRPQAPAPPFPTASGHG